MRMIVTGGHLSPALALIERAIKSGDRILFVGRKYASRKSSTPSREKPEVEKLGASFERIPTVKLDRDGKFRSLLKAPVFLGGVIKSKALIRRFNPDVIMSFGGYVALPMAVAAKISKVPVVTHEQTRTVGLANQIIGKLANRVAISWEESAKHFPTNKTVLTGNPLRKEFLLKKIKTPDWAKNLDEKPIIYVTGGNQGSVAINTVIRDLVIKLTKDYVVIHQCGPSMNDREFTLCKRIGGTLGKKYKNRYLVRSWFTATEVVWIMRNSKIIVSRAGANSVMEIMASGIPSILIPLWFAYKDEQQKNANYLVNKGTSILLNQNDLSSKSLDSAIKMVEKRYRKLKVRANKLHEEVDFEAGEKLYMLIGEVNEEAKEK